jgi:hypothetical protein
LRATAAAAAIGLALGGVHGARAGPFTEPGHLPSVAESWATDDVAPPFAQQGPMDIADPDGGNASFIGNHPANVLGEVNGNVFDVLSLGDGGQITLRFASPIADQPGDDFAVFENGFYSPEGLFAELAFVEVSSDGAHFARFPATCLREDEVPTGGVIDPTDYHNLAGKHPIELGTGFDLAELASHPLVVGGQVDLDDITWLRLVDVIGDGSTVDAQGRPIYDPYPTPFASGGFDANAVAVPEPDRARMLVEGALWVAALSRRRTICSASR